MADILEELKERHGLTGRDYEVNALVPGEPRPTHRIRPDGTALTGHD